MRRFFVGVNVFLVIAGCAVAADQRVEFGSMEYALAIRDGAKARFTFRLVDEIGNAVPDANVKVSFGRLDSKWINGFSDKSGLYTVDGLSSGRVLYNIDKDGYYQTSSEYSFGGEGKIMLEDGKWLPWNPTNTVIIKRIVNPVPMYYSTKDLFIPLKGTNVAFDLETGDWVEPWGRGKYSDLIVFFDDQFKDPWTGFRKLRLTFGTNVLDGVRKYKLDDYSRMRSIYEAPSDGYEKSITWSIEASRKKKDIINEPPRDEYWVFRVRTVVDDKGKIAKENYGKIYGPVRYVAAEKNHLSLQYYFNPEVNSRNLEFDEKKNLLGKGQMKAPAPPEETIIKRPKLIGF